MIRPFHCTREEGSPSTGLRTGTGLPKALRQRLVGQPTPLTNGSLYRNCSL